MWASYTSGTHQFLQQLTNKHSHFDFYFMRNNRTTVVYYEHKRTKSIFVSGKTFSISNKTGSFAKKGFVTMEHIPVTEDGMEIFAERLDKLFPELADRTGVVAIRALQEHKRNNYVLLTQWKNKRYEELWRDSPFYKEQHVQQLARLSAYFAERPFTNEYYMIDEDEDIEELDLEDNPT